MLVIALKLDGLLTENFRKPTNESLTNIHKRNKRQQLVMLVIAL